MSADLVLTNGPVFTADPLRGPAGTVLVRDGRIVAVGADEVRDRARPGAETIDLAGRLLLPGFQDAHVHAVMGGVELGQCDLTGAPDLEDYLRRVRDYADAHPELPWISGGGWAMEVFPGGVPAGNCSTGWSRTARST